MRMILFSNKRSIAFALLSCATFFFLQNMSNAKMLSTTTQAVDYQVIPLPNEIVLFNGGNAFQLNASVKIVYPKGNKGMHRCADLLAQYLKDNTGISCKTGTKYGMNDIVLHLDAKVKNPEGYTMEVKTNRILISASSEAGIFYGIQTMRKSVPVAKLDNIDLPAAQINDAPRFRYRGMHLDVARHFFSVSEIKTYIDILALHNVNTFHWHLTDDQGWRVEIKKYPRLTQIGSQRAETVIGHNSDKYDATPYNGFYTQKQIREIIAYAKERYINVVPEIDLPGHMQGALAAYPELGCTGGPYKVWCKWGISKDVLCAGNDKTLLFIKDVLTELTELFPSEYIHIGGDECIKENWKTCPKCQSRIKQLNLMADAKHSSEERLQSYLIAYAEKVLSSKQRKTIGWDEILEGGIAPNATVMSWRGMDGGIEAAKLKHDVIMTPNSNAYFDHYQAQPTESEPLAIGGYLPLEMVYNWEPQPSELTETEKKQIIGVQANLWTEYIPDFKQIEYMLLPRLAAIAEVQWTNADKRKYNDFKSRIPSIIGLYSLYQYNFKK